MLKVRMYVQCFYKPLYSGQRRRMMPSSTLIMRSWHWLAHKIPKTVHLPLSIKDRSALAHRKGTWTDLRKKPQISFWTLASERRAFLVRELFQTHLTTNCHLEKLFYLSFWPSFSSLANQFNIIICSTGIAIMMTRNSGQLRIFRKG